MTRWILATTSFLLALSLIGTARSQEAKDSKEALAAEVAELQERLAPALKEIEDKREAILKDWIDLAQIPSPSKHEQKRAELVRGVFKAAGLAVSTDKIGNVIGLLRGTKGEGRKKLVVCAHMDTVFDLDTDVAVKREGAILRGPGVGDDTSGLINLITVVRLIARHKLSFEQDIWFVASVQEELGLIGAKSFMDERGDQVEQFISIDGGFGSVSYGALGIHWYKLRFKGKARHTLRSMGQPSTTEALAKTIARIYQLKVPREPEMKQTWYNIGRVGGGKVVNAQAKEVYFTIDLRSLDGEELVRLEQAVFGIARAAAYEVGVECEIETVQKFPAAQIPGMRKHRLTQGARTVLEAVGHAPVLLKAMGASDHCTAIARGIPGINIGTAVGKGAHSLEESVDTTLMPKGIQQALLLVALNARLTGEAR